MPFTPEQIEEWALDQIAHAPALTDERCARIAAILNRSVPGAAASAHDHPQRPSTPRLTGEPTEGV